MTPITESEEENVYEAIADEDISSKKRSSRKRKNGHTVYDNNSHSADTEQDASNTYIIPSAPLENGDYVDVIRA